MIKNHVKVDIVEEGVVAHERFLTSVVMHSVPFSGEQVHIDGKRYTIRTVQWIIDTEKRKYSAKLLVR